MVSCLALDKNNPLSWCEVSQCRIAEMPGGIISRSRYCKNVSDAEANAINIRIVCILQPAYTHAAPQRLLSVIYAGARKDEETQGNHPEGRTQDQQKEIPGDGTEPQKSFISLS